MTEKPLLSARKFSERPHVLIVSDDFSLANFFNEGLPLGGFWTTVIGSGLQALEVFRLRQFDIILLDYQLQSFDALEFVRRLRGVSTRSAGSTARTIAPIVLVSDEPIEIDPKVMQELGIHAAFNAPIELEEITPQLHQLYEIWREQHPHTMMSDQANLLGS